MEGPAQSPEGWGTRLLEADLDLSVGALSSRGNTGLVADLGPVLRASLGSFPISVELGVGSTFISSRENDEDDFGLNLQFTSHGGISIRLSDRASLSYHLEHMSNANLASSNPGLNLHALTLMVRL